MKTNKSLPTDNRIVNSLTDLIAEAGRALHLRDTRTINRLWEINEQWLQTDEEREAVQGLLDSMLEAIEDAEEAYE